MISLIALCIHYSALTIIMHISRTNSHQSYKASSAVVLTEFFKLLISICLGFIEKLQEFDRLEEVMNQLKLEIFQPGWWKLSVPAIMFVLQNNLQYIAASNLSVPLFQITYQLKILTTALCSVLLLNRTLYKSQWIALFLLSVGVAAVQLHAQAEDHPPISSSSESSLPHVPKQMNQLLGLLSVLLACVSSGFASVYFERVLKSTLQPRMGSGGATSVWIRNIQLSFFGFLMGGLIVHIEHQRSTPKMLQEFWNGFDWMVWCVIGFQVIGGLLNALVIKFSDNIAKGFATSVSILISFGLSLVLFEFKLSLGSLMGIGLVVFSTWFFNVSQDQLDRLGRKLNLKR
ncbi:uncharacterized protein MELLADRAFT_45116 [Melampsora larici-populina 98AG31]|uniref:UDP-galactose transporter n=1 Tax=Melampsora larici-populina (strain 98AG31 / pathotype 3-4-7) TaxID=747676 RepID=F4S1J3_MELLP|nr:uncharacterized protein MELLADRAFT_45116 [Melampsora larici-populina 98AG31]EGG01495.1 hypothetical protein MELLADRAFT_45116 [Melampsora larici-populina 98AG31]